jgi:hypothetical protein
MQLNIPEIITFVKNMARQIAVAIMCGLLCLANVGDVGAMDGGIGNGDAGAADDLAQNEEIVALAQQVGSDINTNIANNNKRNFLELENALALLNYINGGCANTGATVVNPASGSIHYLRKLLASDAVNDVDASVARVNNMLYAELAKNVVRVSCFITDQQGKIDDVSIGTGTLIDLGIPGLEGKVVLTCQHCFGRGTGGHQSGIIKQGNNVGFFRKTHEGRISNIYLSVQAAGDSANLITSVNDHKITRSHVIRFYRLGETGVAILDNPITDSNNRTITGLAVADIKDCHEGWNALARNEKTPRSSRDFIIGYGWYGLEGSIEPYAIRTNRLPEVIGLIDKENGKGKTLAHIVKQLIKKLGWNRKKVVYVTTNDSSSYTNNMNRVGIGFSGSLVMELPSNNMNCDMLNLKWVGMYSGVDAKSIEQALSYVAIAEGYEATKRSKTEIAVDETKFAQLVSLWKAEHYKALMAICNTVVNRGCIDSYYMGEKETVFLPPEYITWWSSNMEKVFL